MIFGNIYKSMLEEQLAVLPAPLQSATRFLKDNDMAAHEPGVFNIELDGLPVILQVLDLDTKDGWIDLVNLAECNPQKPIVINTAARNIIGVTEHGLTLQTTLRDLERELFTLWVINRQRDSLELLSYYRDLFPDRIHVFMNLYFGDSHKFELYQKSKIKKEVEDAGGKSIFFPDLADRVTDAINIERIPISKAMNNMPLGNKAELRRWRDECSLIFEDLEF